MTTEGSVIEDPKDVEGVIQSVRFALYRENVYGALEILEAAQASHPDPRYAEQAARIRSWLTHLESREAYIGAQEQQYRRLRWRAGLKLLERRIRMLLGRKTRKMVERRGRDPEFQELERQVQRVTPRRALDAGSGEGGVAMHSFAVLEHVRNVDETIASIMTVLRPGGRFCFDVPMHEFRVKGPIPEYAPLHGYADHCRVFTEAELRRRFGGRDGFSLVKIPGEWKHGELADCFEPIEFGSFFVSYSKPTRA